MIAIANRSSSVTTRDRNQSSSHEQFLAFLPRIRRHAELSFRYQDPEAREESVAEAIAYAWSAFHRLAQLGRLNLAYAAALAQFGVARVRDGRSVGCRASARDPMSARCQRRKGVRIESLDGAEAHDDGWRQVLVEDHRAGPAAIATMRLDFDSWLASLCHRDRCIAEVLARGETTSLAAKRFGLTTGRISQLRRKLYLLWLQFQGELRPPQAGQLQHVLKRQCLRTRFGGPLVP